MEPIDRPRRRGNPNMKPGAPSVNPSGRPKGAAGLARLVAEQTRDGAELVERLLKLSRDAKAGARERLGATLALLDRLAGRPLQSTELTVVAEAHVGDEDLSGLSVEQLAELEALEARRDAIMAAGAVPDDHDVIDVRSSTLAPVAAPFVESARLLHAPKSAKERS
jgi:hypothetical protein